MDKELLSILALIIGIILIGIGLFLSLNSGPGIVIALLLIVGAVVAVGGAFVFFT